MEIPEYNCGYDWCRKKSILKSPCCSKHYCSRDHCQWDSKGHKNCSFLETLEGCKSIAAFDINDPEDHFIHQNPILLLPDTSKSSPSCLDCGVVVEDKDRCILCQWPLCVSGCQFEAKASHTAMECRILEDASERALVWDGDVTKYGAIWLIRIAILKSQQPDLFRSIRDLSKRLSPPEELKRISEILTSNFLVEQLLDEVDLSGIYGLIRNHFRSLSPSHRKNILVLDTSLVWIPHGCFPNLKFSIANDKSLTIWPIKPIEANENLWICYDSSILLLPKKARRDLLKVEACNCERCEDPSEFNTYFSSVNCKWCQARGDDKEIGKLCESSVSNVYICSVCHRKFDPSDIEELERNYSEDIARSWNSLHYLKLKLRNDFRSGTNHSLIHNLHHLYFQSSWRLLELLLRKPQLSVGFERVFQDFLPQAQTVHRILNTFVPFEIHSPSGPVRLMSCILLLNLAQDIKTDQVGLVQAEENLRSIFFWMKNDPEFSKDFQIYSNSRALTELDDLERHCRDVFVRTVVKIVKVKTPVKRIASECLSFVDLTSKNVM